MPLVPEMIDADLSYICKRHDCVPPAVHPSSLHLLFVSRVVCRHGQDVTALYVSPSPTAQVRASDGADGCCSENDVRVLVKANEISTDAVLMTERLFMTLRLSTCPPSLLTRIPLFLPKRPIVARRARHLIL